MKRYFKIAMLLAFAALFLGTFFFLWKKAQPKEFRYETVSPQKRTLTNSVIASGKVQPANEVMIKPQISGIISEIRVKAGDDVKKGDVIAMIKVVPEMSTLNSAEGRLTSARINLEKVRKDFARTEELYRKEIASLEEYEAAQNSLDVAEEELRNAKDALDIVREGVTERYAYMSNTLVRSTIDGKVLEVPVEVGNSVIQANTFNDGTTIATVADMNNMMFKGEIDEVEVGKLKEGMEATVRIGAVSGSEMKGMLTFIAPKAKVAAEGSSVVKFEIEAVISENPGYFVRAGYSANAEIVTARAEDVLSVPEGCVRYDGEQAYVEVYEKEEGGKQVFARRNVRLGFTDGVHVEITEGIGEDDLVKGNIIIGGAGM